MIRIMDKLWVGGANDWGNAKVLGIEAMLNVAQDLRGHVGWPEVEYMQVGLIDGPGNPTVAYCAAVTALDVLLRHHKTLVCCHGGSRSVAVALMYLEAKVGKRGWGGWLDLLRERVEIDLPMPHDAHRSAFDKIDWQALRKLLGD